MKLYYYSIWVDFHDETFYWCFTPSQEMAVGDTFQLGGKTGRVTKVEKTNIEIK